MRVCGHEGLAFKGSVRCAHDAAAHKGSCAHGARYGFSLHDESGAFSYGLELFF